MQYNDSSETDHFSSVQAKPQDARTAKQKSSLAILGFLLSLLLVVQPNALWADEPAGAVWVLTETLVNPDNVPTEYYGGGATPGFYSEPRFEGKKTIYSVSETSFGIDDRDVDHGYEYHNVSVQASFQKPPAELVPGETVELVATFSHSGTAEDLGVGIRFWYSGEGVAIHPSAPFFYSPWHPDFDGTSSATYTFQVLEAWSGGEIEISASLWNAPPSWVLWRYQADPAGYVSPTPEPTQEEEEAPPEDEPRKPVIILPGIYGSYLASVWDQGAWLYNRGLQPDLLTIDPLAHFYDDIVATLKNAGYVEGKDLFIGAYDWRMPPGPVDGSYDGMIQGISGLSITDDLYEYGVDYLGHNLKQAAERWRQDHDGEILDSVDIISHSTGGLVARSYIQSTAYGQHLPASDGEGVRLPRVNNLIMVAVPNRGAALPWQAMNNNFIRDASSKYVMAKILANSWVKVQKGFSVEGPPAPITPQSVLDPATGQLNPVNFISLYCPTLRSLLATYPFIVDRDGNLAHVNGLPQYRNDLVLNLNNGLDLPDRPASADPNLFANAVNRTVVFSASSEATAHQMQETNTAASNVVFPMDALFEQDVAAGTTWFRDIAAEVGDGTVPSLSAAGQFEGDGRIQVIRVTGGDTTHTGLMANRDVQTGILGVLGVDRKDVEISMGLASPTWNVLTVLTDPVGFVLVDGQGRRLGWTPDTGILTEIPNSVWYGEGDGIGFVYDEVPGPLRVELVGLDDDYSLQVAGAQGEQQIGLDDGGFLASAEIKSVVVETRAKVGSPALTTSQSSESENLLLIGVVVVIYALIALVLIAIILTVARRRRRT